MNSVLLACYADGVLSYAGKAGSGLSGATAQRLQRLLTPRPDSVLQPAPPPSPDRIVHWCEPSVVVEVEFANHTDDGRLRHPVFRSIRTDKPAHEACGDA